MDEYFEGMTFVFRGCRDFYRDRHAWKYAALPMAIMFLVYILATWALFYFADKGADLLNRHLTALPQWLAWLQTCVNGLSWLLAGVIALFLLNASICTLYELFGGFFFDSLVEYHEQKHYAITPREFCLKEDLRFTVESIFFGIKTATMNLMLFLLGLCIPVAGPILLALVMGYYLALSYMVCPANNSHLTIKCLNKAAKLQRKRVLGFGITAYLLLLIPLATLFLLPGLVVGGAELFHEIHNSEK